MRGHCATATVIAVLTCAAAAATTQPASRPARDWGDSKAGVQASILAPDAIRAKGALSILPALRNLGTVSLDMPPGAQVRAWLLIQLRGGEGEERFYTVPFALWAPRAMPEKLHGGGAPVAAREIDVAALGVHPYDLRATVLPAYVTGQGLNDLPRPTRTVGDLLAAGELRAKMTVVILRKDAPALALGSNVVEVAILPPDLAALPPDQRRAFVAGLLAQFDRSAWGGQAAHDTAVRVGRPIVPDLIEAMGRPPRPWFSRLWIATALADIPDPRAAAALVTLLDDRQEGVRHVVAYHGPKQHDAALDGAIVAAAAAGDDPSFTARALLGFLVFRRQTPEKLLSAGIDSPDPRARAAVAKALTKQAGDFNVSRLAALLKDKEPRVRSAAATALGEMGRGGPLVLEALIAALDLPGEPGRVSICRALGQLTGVERPYDGGAPEAQRQKVIEDWKAWWREHRAKD